MNIKGLVSICVVLAAAVIMVQTSGDVDADDGNAFYCYTYNMTFYYEGGTPDLDDVRWSAVGVDADGNEKCLTVSDYEDSEMEWHVMLDQEEVSSCVEVRITQTAVRDDVQVSETNTYKIVRHLDHDEHILITFQDGYSGALIEAVSISDSTLIEVGDDFVRMPAQPSREGYHFDGWFTSDGQRFDPKEPVTEDTAVYAGWTSAGGSGHPIYVDKTYVVTFDVAPGMDYTVFSSGKTVTFTVSAAEGFELDGDPRVSASAGSLSNDGLTYTLSGISSDVVVTIDGDTVRVDGQEPAPSDDGFPWIWVVVVLVIVVAVLAVTYYYRSRL